MKKLSTLLILLILLVGGAWLLLRYSPETLQHLPIPGLQKEKVAHTKPSTSNEYQIWRDSLEYTDQLIRDEVDPKRIGMLKERQTYFWKRLQSVRNHMQSSQTAIDPLREKPKSDQDLVRFLTKVLTITAIALFFLIAILYLFLHRRKAALTRKLETLQQDTRFSGARAGNLNEAPPTPRAPRTAPLAGHRPAPNSLPPTVDLDLSALQFEEQDLHKQSNHSNTQSLPTSGLRPTAKQRVTMALQGLAEALGTLRSDPTEQKPAGQKGHHAGKAPSPNVFRPTQANTLFTPTRFEQEKDDSTEVVKLYRRGFTPSEIARRLRVPQDKVEMIIRLHRD